jgi:hypothetical protein
MLDFRRNIKTRNYLARSEQRRLLVWVLVIGVPVILIVRMAESRRSEPNDVSVASVNTRIYPRQPADVPDAFVSLPPRDDRAEDGTGAYFRGVKPDYLRAVRDDTWHRDSERDAWFNLLEVLREADPQQLEAASLGPIAFVQIFQQPEYYRGKLVTIEGKVHRAHRLFAFPNDQGIEGYWQLWIEPVGGPAEPVVVYALELPEGFPTGMDVQEPVRVTGFFYKRWAYGAADGIRTAPLLLVRTVQWQQVDPTARPMFDTQLSIVVMVSIVGGLGLLAVYSWLNRAAPEVRREPVASPENLRALEREEVVEVRQVLAELARDRDAGQAE